MESAPHSEVLKHAALMVTHAGHGSVVKALAAGVPMVMMPFGRDQNEIAARAAYPGAGVKLGMDASAAKIARAVQTVLDDPAYRDAAQRAAKTIASEAGARRRGRRARAARGRRAAGRLRLAGAGGVLGACLNRGGRSQSATGGATVRRPSSTVGGSPVPAVSRSCSPCSPRRWPPRPPRRPRRRSTGSTTSATTRSSSRRAPTGNVWVVVGGDTLARFAPDGTEQEFPLTGVTGAKGITSGPDGNLSLTATSTIVRVPPANPTAGLTEFMVNDVITPNAIVAGPDGNLWTASNDKVLKITTADPANPTLFTLTSADVAAARAASRAPAG